MTVYFCFSILIAILIYCLISLLRDFLIFRKFKPGYYLEALNIKYHALGLYDSIKKYKIIAIEGQYICVKEIIDKKIIDTIIELNLYDLLSEYDKIIIRNELGYTEDILYKKECYE